MFLCMQLAHVCVGVICDVKICAFHVFIVKASTRVPYALNCMSQCNKMCVCARSVCVVCACIRSSLGTQAFPATYRRVINCTWVNTLKAGKAWANTSREGRRWVDAGSRAPLTG